MKHEVFCRLCEEVLDCESGQRVDNVYLTEDIDNNIDIVFVIRDNIRTMVYEKHLPLRDEDKDFILENEEEFIDYAINSFTL